MDRRDFIKNSATAAVAGAAMAIPGISAVAADSSQVDKARTPSDGIAHRLKYNADGKIKILQLTDTHYIEGDERSERAYNNVCKMLDIEKPDFVIHTGDIVFGKPAEGPGNASRPDGSLPLKVPCADALAFQKRFDVKAVPNCRRIYGYTVRLVPAYLAEGKPFSRFDGGSF